ncbi:MAG: helix-turn-helix domain-containing protein [Solirubrobacterales bacterium]
MTGIGKFVGCLSRGLRRSKLAGDSKISREAVSRIAARVGFPARQRGPKIHDWETVRTFYDAGHSAEECKRRFGFSDATWTAAICRGEITPRPRTTQRPPGERRRAVANLLDQGLGIAEIARKLGVSKPTVCYHARKLGVPSRREFARRFDWGEIRGVYESGVAMRECRRRFGFSSQAWADAVRRGDITPRSRLLPLDALLVVGRRTNRTHLKGRLLAEGLKQNRCEQCGITEWQRKPLNLQLHHVNGDGTDNRLENLRFLCANCHSQTDTYGGRNGHRRRVPADAETA